MKNILTILVALFAFLSLLSNPERTEIAIDEIALEGFNKPINLCILLEVSSGPESQVVDKGNTGAILEELIKAIEQDIIIIANSILLKYLKILIEQNTKVFDKLAYRIEQYSFFQTEQNHFTLLMPKKYNTFITSMGFNNNLKETNFETVISPTHFNINLNELKSIFNNNITEKSIYLSGHGIPLTWSEEPLIASLTLAEYKELIHFFNHINCTFLFVSSCYAAGVNMINVHADLIHSFPIIIGNLTDSFSKLYPVINFKKYFFILSKIGQNLTFDTNFLNSNIFKKAIKKICGTSLNNTPWLKLPNSNKFFIVNLHNNLIINEKQTLEKDASKPLKKEKSLTITCQKNLLINTIAIDPIVKFVGIKLPEIISVIPGNAYHIFQLVKAKNQTLYDLINHILKTPYEFTKVFYFKKIKVKKPKRKLSQFKVITLKNLLIVNYGTQTKIDNLHFRAHELYFQKGDHYHRILIPVGIKLGYLEMESNTIPIQHKNEIIHNFLQLAKPSDHILKLINEFPENSS